ncbi:MAG: ATP-binding protein [Bacteroidales bacterium]|nr:ATP-binding protein [Bacteroidales bacterium]
MWIERYLRDSIINELIRGQKLIVLYGARQTGKTSLLTRITSELPYRTIRVNADQARYRQVFSGQDLRKMQELVEGYDLLFIDEGQKIPEIGIHLKILHDELPDLRILVTGSSSFDLATKLGEPLTGRKRVFTLFPVSQEELCTIFNPFELKNRLGDYLIFGSYPEVLTQSSSDDRFEALREISESYLMKDIIEISQIRHVQKAYELLKLLAFQIGSEVSIHELSQSLKINHETVESYLGLFEKAFILFRLGGFSRNLRNEIKKSSKLYFWDLGIRNYLIGNMNRLDQRNDMGALFENFLVAERQKWLINHRSLASSYFWRLYTGAEIDYIEDNKGVLSGYEIKWGKGKVRIPKSWIDTYKAEFKVLNRENYLDFIK